MKTNKENVWFTEEQKEDNLKKWISWLYDLSHTDRHLFNLITDKYKELYVPKKEWWHLDVSHWKPIFLDEKIKEKGIKSLTEEDKKFLKRIFEISKKVFEEMFIEPIDKVLRSLPPENGEVIKETEKKVKNTLKK